MKKFLYVVCCLALVLSLMILPTFAMAAPSLDAVGTSEEAMPRIATQGLWYRENLYFSDVVSVPVTPESGAALNVWTDVTIGPINITVYQTTALGTYSLVYSQSFSPGERDVNVVSNCNGRKYLVKFSAPSGGGLMDALIYQH